MTCCHCEATERQFGKAVARRNLKSYRQKGPDRTTRLLLEAIRATGLRSTTLLDIGAGVGVVHHELLADVCESAVHVEAASAYLAAARRESERRGHGERVRFVHGDFTDLAEELPESDIVTLDRVLCCYPDLERLLAASARKARRLYAASYPRDRWYLKAAVFLHNAVRRLTGNEFRAYVHPVARIDELLSAAGLTRRSCRDTFVWRIASYSRSHEEGEEPASGSS